MGIIFYRLDCQHFPHCILLINVLFFLLFPSPSTVAQEKNESAKSAWVYESKREWVRVNEWMRRVREWGESSENEEKWEWEWEWRRGREQEYEMWVVVRVVRVILLLLSFFWKWHKKNRFAYLKSAWHFIQWSSFFNKAHCSWDLQMCSIIAGNCSLIGSGSRGSSNSHKREEENLTKNGVAEFPIADKTAQLNF